MPEMRQRYKHQNISEDDILIRSLHVIYPEGNRIHEHTHTWHQLIYPSQGVIAVHTDSGSWVVPPQRAVWVPAGIKHKMEIPGSVSVRSLYLRTEISQSLVQDCCVLNVSPLMRELILHVADIGMLSKADERQSRLIGVLLDQLEEFPAIPLQIPMPRDARAQKAAELVRSNPSDNTPLQKISKMVGASKRTLERLFLTETNMTFGRWRQQLRLLHALKLLAIGENVTNVALEAGYESTSAFIAVFKQIFGTTPGRYYKDS
ncbi:MAG TPA: helix-turn-helix transcriptional regulator [Blastocatellia bacterium]|nr:helix-turn-helix transcriptional regulator [Blastocatellia bacterium]